MEFFLNPGQIPLQRDQISQKILPRLIKSMFENIKWGINVSCVVNFCLKLCLKLINLLLPCR